MDICMVRRDDAMGENTWKIIDLMYFVVESP